MKTLNLEKIAVIGAGGIGRSLAVVAAEYSRRNIPYLKTLRWTFFDNDEVEEENCWTQGFRPESAYECQSKIEALKADFARQLQIAGVESRIDQSNLVDLLNFDLVFIAVDNLETRQMIYDLCLRHEKPFVDMRVNGTLVLVQDHTLDREELMATLQGGNSEENAAPTSCLAKWEKEQKIIHSTPMVAATLGFQFMLNLMRGYNNEPVERDLGGA